MSHKLHIQQEIKTMSSFSNDIMVVSFAEAKQPEFKERKGRGYVEFGDRNDYPDYLLSLFNKSAKHGAIVRGKSNYISGNGFTGGNEKMAKPNPTEKIDDILRKVVLDAEIFGGYFLEIIWANSGKSIAEMRHIDYTKIRTNKDCTEFYYKKDWKNYREDPDILPAFNPDVPAGRQILYVKDYRPGQETYSLPNYFNALNYIEADVKVSEHVLGNALTGFSASKLITLPNGEPSDDEKRKITKAFENTFSGADGKKFILSFVQNSERKPIVDDLGASDLTKEDFTNVDNIIQMNIYAGHQITSPSLFGIAEPGKLGTRTEMRDAYEVFKNTYVNDRQQAVESVFNMILGYWGGGEELKITPVEPIGYEFSEATLVANMTREEIREKLGLAPLENYQKIVGDGITNTGATEEQKMVNENVKNLTGRQHQQLLRIIRQFGQGKITKEIATTLLKTSLGLGDAEVATLLSIDNDSPEQFSEAEAINIFDEYGEARDEFTVHQSRPMSFRAKDVFFDFRDIQILEILKKQPLTPPGDLAKALNLEPIDIVERLDALKELGILDINEETRRATIKKPVSDLVKEMERGEAAKKRADRVDFDIRYSYEWKPIVPSNERDSNAHPSRPFCRKLIDLDRFYTRQEIESISRRLGYDVFTRGGGWWGDSPSCRHEWRTNIVVKKNK